MENLIEVINQIQSTFVKANLSLSLELPIIAVVGAQSTGKSSVLETIVGKDFLPRGSGIVTRRPLILQLRFTKEGREYAMFGHKAGRVYENFDEVRKEIEIETDRVAGNSKGISDEPIILEVYSYKVFNLTLVDLPGLTNIPVQGQSENIVQLIREIVLKVVKRENALILAVTAGNTDLANSDALRLAREVDPNGDRTIGVITKLDIMDEKTNAMDALEGRLYKLKLGYIGVVCRSQKDINEKKSMEEALKFEERFFTTHPAYSRIKNCCGIRYLAKTLSKLLLQHIQKCMPSLKSDINTALQIKKDEIKDYGIDFSEKAKSNPKELILLMISKFTEYYEAVIDGKLIKDITKELRGGARIRYIFDSVYLKKINGIKALEGLTDEHIRATIINTKSLHPSLFIPDKAFEVLVKEQSSKLLDLSLQCMNMVHEELQRIVFQQSVPELRRFEKLTKKIFELMIDMFNELIKPTGEMIKNLIEVEKCYPNTNHPDMAGMIGRLMVELDVGKVNAMNENSTRIQEQKRIAEETQKKAQEEEKVKKEEGQKRTGFFYGIFGSSKEAKEEPKQAEVKVNMEEYLGNRGRSVQKEAPYDLLNLTNSPSTRELTEVAFLKRLLEMYFNITKKNIADLIPKAIMTFLVKKSKEKARNELVKSLYAEEDVENLMEEDPIISNKRKQCKIAVEALEEAVKVLNGVSYKELS